MLKPYRLNTDAFRGECVYYIASNDRPVHVNMFIDCIPVLSMSLMFHYVCHDGDRIHAIPGKMP